MRVILMSCQPLEASVLMTVPRLAVYFHFAVVLLALVAIPLRSTAQTFDATASAVVRARQDLEATTRGCFEKGWGTRTAYTTMTFGEAVPRSREFAALHRQRARELSSCAVAAAGAMNQYQSAVDDFKAKLLLWSRDAQKMRLVAHALDGSATAMDQLIRSAFPKVVRLEHRLGEFFSLLDQVRPSSSSRPLEFPEDIVRLENEIAHAMRVQTSAAVGYLQAMYTLFPSPALRTRLAVTRILDVVYRATDEVMSADETTQSRAVKQYVKAVSQAKAMAQAEAQAADTRRIPGAVVNYIEMSGHFESVLSDIRKMVQAMDESREGLTAGELAVVRQEEEKILLRMEAALERIETLAVRIDGVAAECIGKRC